GPRVERPVKPENDVPHAPACHHDEHATAKRSRQAKNYPLVQRKDREFLALEGRVNEQAVAGHVDDFLDLAVLGGENSVAIAGGQKHDGKTAIVKTPCVHAGQQGCERILGALHGDQAVLVESTYFLNPAVARTQKLVGSRGDGAALWPDTTREQRV